MLGGYFFLPVMRLMLKLNIRNRGVQEWSEDEKKQMKECYQSCFNALHQHLEIAKEKNCSVLVKEHTYFIAHPASLAKELHCMIVDEPPWMVEFPERYNQITARSAQNETVLPDGFLREWLPIFLIRHPALAFPSYYRTYLDNDDPHGALIGGDQGTLAMTLHWVRQLYEWYSHNLTAEETFVDVDVTWPLVLDGDDVMANKDVVLLFGEIIQLDTTKMHFSWTAIPEEQQAKIDPRMKRMLCTLLDSEGIIKGKTAENIDIDVEVKKWQDEFGERAAGILEKSVRAAIPDYEFLKARKLKAKMKPSA